MTTITTLTSNESGANSLTDINTNFSALNTGKVETSQTVNGKALTANITLGLASADFANQGTATTVLHGNASGNPGFSAVVEADITLADNTTNDVSTSKHGLAPKAPNDATKFLDGTGAWTSPVSAPTGSLIMYAGSAAPTGYVLCDGSSLLRAGTYAALFAIISTTYGSADGTHFNVPDLRGRVPVGVGTGSGGGSSGTGLPSGGSALTAVARGTWKGEETHLLTGPESGIPAHSHNVTYGTGGAVGPAVGGSNSPSTIATTTTGDTTAASAHNIIQPVMGVNFIIKI